MSEVIEQQAPSQVTNMFQVLERAAINPEVNVEKMERIYQMVERAEDRQALQSFNAAMVEVQKKVGPIYKTEWNAQTKSWYVGLAEIANQVNDIFTGEGFFLMFSEGDCPDDDSVRVVCDIGHNSGHTIQRHADIPISVAGIGGKIMMTPTHGKGSALTYGRKYLTIMLANLPTPDNDGNGAPVVQDETQVSEGVIADQLRGALDMNALKAVWDKLTTQERKSHKALLDECKKVAT